MSPTLSPSPTLDRRAQPRPPAPDDEDVVLVGLVHDLRGVSTQRLAHQVLDRRRVPVREARLRQGAQAGEITSTRSASPRSDSTTQFLARDAPAEIGSSPKRGGAPPKKNCIALACVPAAGGVGERDCSGPGGPEHAGLSLRQSATKRVQVSGVDPSFRAYSAGYGPCARPSLLPTRSGSHS